jgi:hypothetical protein
MYYRLWEMQQGNFVIRETETDEAPQSVADDEDTVSYT